MSNWTITSLSYGNEPHISWMVINSVTKRTHTCSTLEEAEVIVKALNELEE